MAGGGWNEQRFEEMHNQMPRTGIRPALQLQITQLVEGRFGSIEKLFDRAAGAHFQPRAGHVNTSGQQQLQQQQHRQPEESSK